MLPVRKSIGGLGNLMFKQAYLVSEFLDGKTPDIYVQSERFWRHNKDRIKTLYQEGIGFINRVSLHIRRGDYLDTDFYVNLPKTNYYEEAVKMFPDDQFIAFCHDGQDPTRDAEDREWVKQFLDSLIPGRYMIHEPMGETKDLNQMASCKHNIMANSTFSWWAAYLNKNPNKKVVCPASWFSDGVQRCELLDEWIKI